MMEGEFFDGKVWSKCRIIRQGAKNTRIQLADDGSTKLWPSDSVKICALGNKPLRIIPSTPLERLYLEIRSFHGSKHERYSKLSRLLSSVRGNSDVAFLTELFCRSVDQSARYSNIDEGFYADRNDEVLVEGIDEQSHFAQEFVRKIGQSEVEIKVGASLISYVDYEIAPFRTTLSAKESGSPGSRSGAGGMDLLLDSSVEGKWLPAVGEIKAATESVGPTFALIQAMNYASQLATKNQAERLRRHYPDKFEHLDRCNPQVDILVFLENRNDDGGSEEDLRYSRSLAEGLVGNIGKYVRRIVFVRCGFIGERIKCDAVDAF